MTALIFQYREYAIRILISLVALFAADTAAAQTPQTASVPATTASAARRYEKIAEKKLPGLRTIRPSDIPAEVRKHYSPKTLAKTATNQGPVGADFDGDGHRDFALAMKARHAHSIIAFYVVACLWRKAGYECRRVDGPLYGRLLGGRLEVGDASNDSRCWGAQKKRTWKAPTLMLEPFLGNIVTYYPYDKARDKFHRCDFGD